MPCSPHPLPAPHSPFYTHFILPHVVYTFPFTPRLVVVWLIGGWWDGTGDLLPAPFWDATMPATCHAHAPPPACHACMQDTFSTCCFPLLFPCQAHACPSAWGSGTWGPLPSMPSPTFRMPATLPVPFSGSAGSAFCLPARTASLPFPAYHHLHFPNIALVPTTSCPSLALPPPVHTHMHSIYVPASFSMHTFLHGHWHEP